MLLLLHEVHTVAGRNEDEFEAAFRNGWMPTLGKDNNTRLLYFLRLAHGTGRAYHTVTITALATAPRTSASRRACNAVTFGTGHPTSTSCATKWPGSCCCRSTGLRCRISTSRRCPPTVASTIRCSTWKTARGRTRLRSTATSTRRTHYAPSLEERTARSLLTLLGVFQAALGAPRRREVVLWQRVDFPERLPALFTRELPAHVKGPGTWMHDALEVRDDWESRLLRSASWSPL